ncbi:hypothetical protein [Actinoplanes rectilineatus]|uniref:hypothetical protein n=1 Tax=Actinoplanes rectilineatus TaxID=113571 RepID=UPI000A5847D1|nr:hypothetical protein [Actinoplanes rectilineatus]
MTMPVAPTRPPAPKGALPAGIVLSRYWRESPGGPLTKHDHDRPVDEDTDEPVGLWWMCPAAATCKTGEWVFRTAEDKPGRPKKKFCAEHGTELMPGRAEPDDDNPKQAARNWLQQRLTEKATAAKQATRDAAQQRIGALRAAGRDEADRLRRDLREHVPSAAVSFGALVADWALLYELDALPTYATGAGLAVGGTLLAYWAVYVGELVWARRMGYTIRELPASVRSRARSRARWIAAGVLSTGVWLLIAETIGADLGNAWGVVANMMAAVMIGVVNYNPWQAMVERRKAEARARVEAAEEAARAEEERLTAEAAERDRRRMAAEEAARVAEEAAQTEARKIVTVTDDTVTAGRKFAERWEKVAADAKARNMGPGFEIWRTAVVPEQTRKLTAVVGGETVVIGHEFLIRAEPGVLAPRNGMNVSPFLQMKTWLSSMLELDDGMLDLAYQPKRLDDGKTDTEVLINHGLVTLFDTHPLGEAVKHPGPSGVYTDAKGARWGFAGRDLRGNPVYRSRWTPGQAGGGVRVGVTGMGKSVVTQVGAYNDLLLGILPIIHDAGKNAMDFVDFYGIIPVGHTIEHREIIRESLWHEMKRRQAWINTQTAVGLGGMEVTADPTWDPVRGGPPIRCTWEEFHMHMSDPKFIQYLGAQVRLQRATAIMAEGASQGSGLADWGDQQMKEQMTEISLEMMRVSDHTARLAGYQGGLMPSTLPSLPGMMVSQVLKGDPVAYRSAFMPRDPSNPESLIYRLKRPNGTPEGEQIVFAPQLPPETIAVFKEHGLMDLWEKGKTKSGREQLQSEADPVESTVMPDMLEAILGGQPTPKPRLRADEVVLGLLKNEDDNGRGGLTQQQMLASPWWAQIEGEWTKNAGIPSHTTIGRACKNLSGLESPLIGSDEGTPARWSLLPAGSARGEQALTLLRSAGVLGKQAQSQTRASGMDIAGLERQAMLEAEQAALIQELVREAAGLTGPGQ